MIYAKKDIEYALEKVFFPGDKKNILKNNFVRNIQIFGKDVELDIEISNPTLHYKNKVKDLCVNAIHTLISNDLNIKINLIIKAEDKKPVIKGKSIPGVKNIIAVSSGKGGVGKSTVAANLAVGLSLSGNKVGIIDADIYGPSMHIMFGLEGEKPKAIEINGESKIKPLVSHGIKILSIAFFAQNKQAIVWRGPMASKALNQLIWDAHWGELDYLIVDLPPGTGDIHLSLVQSVPLTGAIVVSTPQNIALADARKGVNMFRMDSIDVPVLGMIENMSYFVADDNPKKRHYIFGKEGAKGLAEQMGIELLSEIPLIQSIREAADAGRPAILQESTIISSYLMKMAINVADVVVKRNENLKPTETVKITHTKGCSS